MRKGQGSLEYLLILAAVMAIAVVVVLAANQAMSSAKKSVDFRKQVQICGFEEIEFPQSWSEYDGTYDKKPNWIKPCGTCYELRYNTIDTSAPDNPEKECNISGFAVKVYKQDGKWSVYLENSDGKYFVYGQKVEAGPPENAIFPVSWEYSLSVGKNECGTASDSAGKTLPNYPINFTFNNEAGDYNLVIWLASGSRSENLNIKVNGQEKDVQCCQGVDLSENSCECEINIGHLNKGTKITIEPQEIKQINICGGTGKAPDYKEPAEGYTHPPYLVPT